MQHAERNQARDIFVLGQIAQAVGDDFFGIKRHDEAGEEYQEALRAYEMVLEA